MYYKSSEGDGSSKNYKILSEMLYDFDRQDIMELYRLVKERYSSSKPEGYDLMLWGDLHTLFEPDEESEIWIDQNEYNLIIIIMAQQQHAADVHPDELCPPNKRYDLMDANKKVDFKQVQCPPESKILTNIIKNHPFTFQLMQLLISHLDIYGTIHGILLLIYWRYYRKDFLSLHHPTSFDSLSSLLRSSLVLHDLISLRFQDVLETGESSDPKWSTVIHFRIPQRRSTRLTPPALMSTVDKAEEMILQDTLQHLTSEEIEKMVEEPKNVIDETPIPRNDDQNIPGTRLEPRSDKECPEVEITNVVIPVNVNEEEEEITDEVYELKRREKGKIELQGRYGYLFEHLRAKFLSRKSFDTLADHLQEVMVESLPTMVDKHIKEQVEKQVPEQERGKLQAKISSQIQQAIDINIPSLVDVFVRSYMSRHILHVHPAQPQTSFVPEQQYQLYLSMKADPQLQQQDIAIWLALQMKFETLQVPQTTCENFMSFVLRDLGAQIVMIDVQPEGRIVQSRRRHLNDDEVPMKQEHKYQEEVVMTIIKQNKENCRKEILASPHPRKTTPLVQSCQRDPEAPALSLINQRYLLFLKKGNFIGIGRYLLDSQFPAISSYDVDIEERMTSRWVNKCVKDFNPYAGYNGVEIRRNPPCKDLLHKRDRERR
ncbi:hypothetical protein Tco_0536877 [Tanacetum coccineum]